MSEVFMATTKVDSGQHPVPAVFASAEAEVGRLAKTVEALSEALEKRSLALTESQAQLMQIINNLPVMISYLDETGRFRFANSIYKEWIGVAPEDLLGRNLEEVYGSEIYAEFRHHIERGLRGERVVYERTMFGARRVEGTLVPHHAHDGRFLGLFVLIQDVTANRTAVEKQARSEERLMLALEGSGSALFDWDLRRDLLYQSAHAAGLLGRPAADETVKSAEFAARLHPDDREPTKARLMLALSGEAEHYEAEFRMRDAAGRWVWLRAMGRVVERDAQGEAVRLAGTHSDITQRKAVEARLRTLAETDMLTGLPNRGVFVNSLARALARHPGSGKVSAVLFIDIDHFKAVNDTFGHSTGDALLVDFAKRLKACVRDRHLVARLAGDEFTIIMEGLVGVDEAAVLAGRLVERTRRTLTLRARSVAISSSIGIALLADGELDVAEVLRRADAALYEAKRSGRDRFAFESRALRVGNTPQPRSTLA